ncbi:MAG TPA: Crp/Fnr family transcriptional regulator [Alphaproteobacteria bacterium]|nr:Crp/Fnr family transcriptional regulator [Alphaproteobacteria bacterium]
MSSANRSSKTPKSAANAQAVREKIRAGLAECAMLKALSTASRAKLAEAGRLAELKPGEILFRRGDQPDAMFIVLEGEVEICAVFESGRQLRYAVAGAGAIIGEMGALDNQPRCADIMAVRRTQLWRMPRASLLGALKDEAQGAIALITALASRLRTANGLLNEVALEDLGGRLAHLLINEAHGKSIVALTQGEMARRVSASREKVNRKLAEFAAANIVSVSRAGVRILDRGKLLAHFHDLST